MSMDLFFLGEFGWVGVVVGVNFFVRNIEFSVYVVDVDVEIGGVLLFW